MIPPVPFGQSLINPNQIVYFYRVLEPVIEKGQRMIFDSGFDALSMNTDSIREKVLIWMSDEALQESLEYTATRDCVILSGNEKFEFIKYLIPLYTLRTFMENLIVCYILYITIDINSAFKPLEFMTVMMLKECSQYLNWLKIALYCSNQYLDKFLDYLFLN